jgi:outer membrane cobalamin receptor
VLDALHRYQTLHRNAARPAFVTSGIYGLDHEHGRLHGADHEWPEDWPHHDKPGVYLVFDAEMKLLYIGVSHWLSVRLEKHFKYGPDESCRIEGTWSSRPAYVLTVAVSEPFEAPSLEAFLIAELNPSDNKLGRKRKAIFGGSEVLPHRS